MAITGEARHELYLHFEGSMGRRMASNLMELLPPQGWDDLATKQDLLQLASLTEERFRHQRELMQEGFARMDERFLHERQVVQEGFARIDERFQAVDKRFEGMATKADIATLRSELYRAFWLQFGAIIVAVGTMTAALR